MPRRRALVLLALLLIIGMALALAPAARRGAEAALVLADLAAGAGDSPLKHLTPAPSRQQVDYEVAGRQRAGDLYLPAEGERGAVVLVPGAAKSGKDDPRLVAFATTLARARLAVLVPDLASLRQLEVSADDRLPIADGVRWLAATHGRGMVGIAAISYAVGPAVLASLEEPRVDLLVAVGGYDDITRVVTFFTTGFVKGEGGWVPRAPNVYGKWVFVASNAERMEDSGDRVALAAIARRKMDNPDAPLDDLTAHLTHQGRAVMALLDNRDPQRVPDLMAALPPAVKDQMIALDLARRDLSAVHAEAWLIHGRDDRIVPAEESIALARALPHAHLVLLDHLAHADLAPGGMADSLILWRAVDGLLAARDRHAHLD